MSPIGVAAVVALILVVVFAAARPGQKKADAGGGRLGAGSGRPCYTWVNWVPGTGPVPAWAVQYVDKSSGGVYASASAHTPYDFHGTTYGQLVVDADPSKWQFQFTRDGSWYSSQPSSVNLIKVADPSCPPFGTQRQQAPKGAWGFVGNTWGPCAVPPTSSAFPGLTHMSAWCTGWDCTGRTGKGCSGVDDGYQFVRPETY